MRTTPRHITTALVTAALVAVLTGCPPTAGGTVLDVSIAGGDRTLSVGSTTHLSAHVHTTGAAATSVTWASTDTTVAAIDPSGTLTALATGTTTIRATSTADPSQGDTISVSVVPPGTVQWQRQFGTAGDDAARGVATDTSGNVYVTGSTPGDLEGTNAGGSDAFVRSYDTNGGHRWTRQFGTGEDEFAYGVATDTSGNVYVTGSTRGDLEGDATGFFDAFVRSYDTNGDYRWTRQFGSGAATTARAVATDASGNVYVAGWTSGDLEGGFTGQRDAFVRSYDADGNHRWTRQFGTTVEDEAWGLTVDGDGNVYVAGSTEGSLDGASAGGFDAFVRSYDRDGNQRWSRQFGTISFDAALGVATDTSGNVYVTGYTAGSFDGSNTDSLDAFVRSYDTNGDHRWTRQFGTVDGEFAWDVATDARGNVYVVGDTTGALAGTNAGNADAYLRSFDSDGNHRWTRQFGTSSADHAYGIAADGDGYVYVVGATRGALAGTSDGSFAVYVRQYLP